MKRICALVVAYFVLCLGVWHISQGMVKQTETFSQPKLPRIIEIVEAEELPIVKEVATSTSSGKASYYDYVLKSGWSSKGSDVCAVRDWPRGTYLEVSSGDKKVVCKVTDFGPNKAIHPDRIVDLSSHAFQQLAPLSRGVIQISIKVHVNNQSKGSSKK